jgi:hypothetical protein
MERHGRCECRGEEQMRRLAWTVTCLVTLLDLSGSTGAAGVYPLTLTAKAQATQGETTITSTIKIYVDRLMEPSRRTRVLDGLKYNGYQGFMNALRPLPPIGRLESQRGRVDLRYAWETQVENGRRLVLVADKPLFFLAADTAKPRAGYELTVVDLVLDEHNAGKGSMAGAARVKPAPDSGIVLEDFASALVTLTVEPAP